jgi:hypothetical protein
MGETAGESMKMGMEKAMSENTAVSRGNPRRKEESDAKRKPVIGQRELGGCPTQGTQNPGGGRAVCCAAAACQRGAKHAACRAPGGYTAAGQARADGFRSRWGRSDHSTSSAPVPATMRRGAGEEMGGKVFRGTSPVTQRITKRKIGNAAVNRGFAEEIVWRVKANHTCTRVSETLWAAN